MVVASWLKSLLSMNGNSRRRLQSGLCRLETAEVLQMRAMLSATSGVDTGTDPTDTGYDPNDPSTFPTAEPVSVGIDFIDSEMWEGILASKGGRVRVWRDGQTDESIEVSLTTQPGGDGTAAEGDDYSNIPDTVTLPGGGDYAAVEFDVSVFNDLKVEGSEIVVIGIDSSTDFGVSIGSATALIDDNDFWEWNDPSSVPSGDGFFSDSASWSDGSTLDIDGQVRATSSSVSASMSAMFTEANSWLGPTVYGVVDMAYMQFDFEPISGHIFLASSSGQGSSDHEDGPLTGGISWDLAIDPVDRHFVTVNISDIRAVAGGESTWTVTGGLSVQDPDEILTAGLSGSYSNTESWAKTVNGPGFSTTLSVKKSERYGGPGTSS